MNNDPQTRFGQIMLAEWVIVYGIPGEIIVVAIWPDSRAADFVGKFHEFNIAEAVVKQHNEGLGK